MTLGDLLVATLERFGPLSACALAREVGRRKEDVLRELREDPRFVCNGKGRASVWMLVVLGSFDADEAAARWGCSPEMATEIIFGTEGFLDLGLVANLNGNGRVVVTERGLAMAHAIGGMAA